ncbi:EamA family transporter [Burkholderiales bacterium 8X]|nr:EamA family transporter [Burkholderiales bacterium 8X]
MTTTIFLTVLLAAAIHAAWNAVVKSGSDKLATTALVAGAAGLMSAFALPFLPLPAPASWPYMAASVFLQVSYYVLVAKAYQQADMSQAYPLMRGTAALLVALFGAVALRERVPTLAMAGIFMIGGGIAGMAFIGRKAGGRRGMFLALANSVVIATYTVVDGIGVRHSGSAASYTAWLFALSALPLIGGLAAVRGAALWRYAQAHFGSGLCGGAGTLASYGLALWAMTLAPVAMVAALRETSILFGIAIAAWVLKERVDRARVALAAAVALGAVLLRLSSSA